jgi:sugar phosphate isomerase/epimerase
MYAGAAMASNPTSRPLYTRRDFTALTLAAIPAALWLDRAGLGAQTSINSVVNGVHLGAITYSFRSIPDANEIVKAYQTIGLGEMEIMSNHVEALAGIPVVPGGRGRGRRGGGDPPTPDQQAAREAAQKAVTDWRASATAATFKPVREKIAAAGVRLRVLCYNMNVRSTEDAEIEYAFVMAQGLGVDAISTSTQVSMAKRLAPFADKHKLKVGFHNHANLRDDEVATPDSFAAVMAQSSYLGVNLDIGHYTEAGFDAVAFLEQHHARITNLHLKDKKKAANGGGNTPWGQGDTPIKAVLKLVEKNRWDLPANIEFEYTGDPMVEVPKCLQFCKDALA